MIPVPLVGLLGGLNEIMAVKGLLCKSKSIPQSWWPTCQTYGKSGKLLKDSILIFILCF